MSRKDCHMRLKVGFWSQRKSQ